MARMCNSCVNFGKYCDSCLKNPNFSHLTDYFKAYNFTCRFGYEDCIHDPAYIKCHYPDWYQSLYGNKTPEEASLDPEGCANCKNGEDYDDEDK